MSQASRSSICAGVTASKPGILPLPSCTTYLLADEVTREAVLIDPVREQLQRDLGLLRELALRLVYVLDTHVHADHVTAAGLLRAEIGARTVAGRKGPSCADLQVCQGDQLRCGSLVVEVLETPGHTDDSLTTKTGTTSSPATR